MIVACAFGLSLFASGVAAQPQIPATFFGSVTVDGKPAADGVDVRAIVNGQDCSQALPGTRPVVRDGESAAYVLSVVHESQRAGCATAGTRVTFTVGGVSAVQAGIWKPGPIRLDLSTGAAPAVPLPSPTGTIAALFATETAGAPIPTSATLVRPSGTPPTDDVQFNRTSVPTSPLSPIDPAREVKDEDGFSILLGLVLSLVFLGGAGAAIGFALARRRPPNLPGA